MRGSQREIRKGVRDLDREVLALKREEQKLILEIKAAAKANNQPAMRVLAKSLVRLRNQIAHLQGSQANLRGVSTQITTAAASATVASSMATATAAMSKMQQQTNPAKVRTAAGTLFGLQCVTMTVTKYCSDFAAAAISCSSKKQYVAVGFKAVVVWVWVCLLTAAYKSGVVR